MNKSGLHTIYGAVYRITSGSNVYKYVCAIEEIEDSYGVTEMVVEHSDGLAEIAEDDGIEISRNDLTKNRVLTPDEVDDLIKDADNIVPQFFQEEDEEEITFVDIDGSIIDTEKEEWMALNTPIGGDPVDMEALWESHNSPLG